MNYRHVFHAGNFADVFKHALLVQLVRALQRKEKGFLYLDTHAGRGSYDLTAAAHGDTLARKPEWPDGIGRLWEKPDLPAALADYVALVRDFDRENGNAQTAPRFYPGSPRLVQRLARPQDRLALCEKQDGECAALQAEFALAHRATVHEMDGYAALSAMLPPPERRALVLLDPPFESQDEFVQIAAALREGLRRLPGGMFAAWYPLTERARVDDFFAELLALTRMHRTDAPACADGIGARRLSRGSPDKVGPTGRIAPTERCGLKLPPTLALELAIAGEGSGLKMRGCGLVVVNPPWQFDREVEKLLPIMAELLVQAPGADATVHWLVPE